MSTRTCSSWMSPSTIEGLVPDQAGVLARPDVYLENLTIDEPAQRAARG